MNSYLKKFNLLCEEQEVNIICEGGLFSWFKDKRWSLEDECRILIPSMTNKAKLAFTNIYNGEPGELQLTGDPQLIPIDEGTQNPGFKIIYYLNDTYVKNNLFPFLKQIDKCNKLNETFHFFDVEEPYDTQLIIQVNAKDDEIDLSQPNVKIAKLSIKQWDGNIYFNFKCKDTDRKKSNYKVGTINVKVKCMDYRGLAEKVLDFLNGVGSQYTKENGVNQTIGEGLSSIFGFNKKKKNTGAWDKIKQSKSNNIPGAIITCTVSIDKSKLDINDTLDNDHSRYTDNEKWNKANSISGKIQRKRDKQTTAEYISKIYNLNPILDEMDQEAFNENILKTVGLTTSINPNMFDNEDVWTTAEKHVEIYESTDNPITQKYFDDAKENVNEYICCTLQPTYLYNSGKKFNKTIQIFFYIINFKESNKGNDLFNERFDSPIFKIIITDNDNNNILYERYYNAANFRIAEPRIYRILSSEIKKLKYK